MTTSVGNEVIKVSQLSVGYSKVPVVHDATLDVRSGEIAALLGPNGSGKSTLLKGIIGVLAPSGGHVVLYGDEEIDVTGMPPESIVHRGVAYVPQLANVFPSLTITENLLIGFKGSRQRTRERVEYVFSLFPDLSSAPRRAARALSGGQREMLAVGRALMSEPKVILIDEPCAGLSPRYQDVVWDQLGRLRDEGVALLVVEQNTRAALEMSNFGYVLVAGTIRKQGPASDLLTDNELVELYIGKQSGPRSGAIAQNKGSDGNDNE
jgi:branched-chain amino acid transport system ATP-binding protein